MSPNFSLKFSSIPLLTRDAGAIGRKSIVSCDYRSCVWICNRKLFRKIQI